MSLAAIVILVATLVLLFLVHKFWKQRKAVEKKQNKKMNGKQVEETVKRAVKQAVKTTVKEAAGEALEALASDVPETIDATAR